MLINFTFKNLEEPESEPDWCRYDAINCQEPGSYEACPKSCDIDTLLQIAEDFIPPEVAEHLANEKYKKLTNRCYT